MNSIRNEQACAESGTGLQTTYNKINASVMPDAMEAIFQEALVLGRKGVVSNIFVAFYFFYISICIFIYLYSIPIFFQRLII